MKTEHAPARTTASTQAATATAGRPRPAPGQAPADLFAQLLQSGLEDAAVSDTALTANGAAADDSAAGAETAASAEAADQTAEIRLTEDDPLAPLLALITPPSHTTVEVADPGLGRGHRPDTDPAATRTLPAHASGDAQPLSWHMATPGLPGSALLEPGTAAAIPQAIDHLDAALAKAATLPTNAPGDGQPRAWHMATPGQPGSALPEPRSAAAAPATENLSPDLTTTEPAVGIGASTTQLADATAAESTPAAAASTPEPGRAPDAPASGLTPPDPERRHRSQTGPHWSRLDADARGGNGQGLTAPSTADVVDTLTRSWHMATPGQPGSAIADLVASATPWGAAVSAMARGGDNSPGTDAGGTGTDGGAAALTDATPSATVNDTTAPADSSGFAMSLGEALGDAYESLGAQVSLWAAAQTKRASVRLDVGGSDALEVDVSLDGGKAQLNFRTDDAQVRDAIKAQAPTVLADLLARAGIALDSVSVGGQGAGQAGGQAADGRPGPWVPLRASADTGPAILPPTRPTPTRNGRLGLDVYA